MPYAPPPFPYRELWERKGEDGPALCALINGEWGWLMYLNEPGDTGYSSRNPDYAGPDDAVIDYVLSNGQRDEYPASWALPVETVERALAYFRTTAERAPFVDWHPD